MRRLMLLMMTLALALVGRTSLPLYAQSDVNVPRFARRYYGRPAGTCNHVLYSLRKVGGPDYTYYDKCTVGLHDPDNRTKAIKTDGGESSVFRGRMFGFQITTVDQLGGADRCCGGAYYLSLS